ncbi:MAG: hypothetical protein E7640_03100 [Ruminococcaceae bacterium]|nr:hypothetical protein [Oscillospiraceae bacterium]
MEVSQVAFALFCAASLVGGAFIGVLYDAFAVLPVIFGKVYCEGLRARLEKIKMPFPLRKRRGFLSTAVFLHDLFTTVMAGVLLILIIYRFNDGQFRIAAPLCFLCGYLLYKMLLSRLVLPLSELSGFAVRYAFSLALFILAVPLRVIARAGAKAAKAIKLARNKKFIKSYSENKKKELLLSAQLSGLTDTNTKYGKKKSKSVGGIGDRRSARAIGDTHGDQYNAVQSKIARGGKARSGAR